MKDALHIYAQPYPHSEAFVVGDSKSLKELRDAIDRALQNGSAAADVSCQDGEEYKVIVFNATEHDTENLILPYTTDDSQYLVGKKHPYALLGSRYRLLATGEER